MKGSLRVNSSTRSDLCDTQSRAVCKFESNEVITVPSFGKAVSNLRFLASVPRKRREGTYQVSVERCDFSLGVGPCGRTVTALWYHVDGDVLTITQECALPSEGESEVKNFIYLLREISGRIVATLV